MQDNHLIYQPTVVLMSRPVFLGVPAELGKPRSDQDQGTDAERLIEAAGRVCYDSYGKGRNSEQYHEHLEEVGHGSVTEHACWSFLLSGVSRGLTHELVRHRVGVAYAQRSTRYVDESDAAWIVPPLFRECEEDGSEVAELRAMARIQFDGIRKLASEGYKVLTDLGEKIMAISAPNMSAGDRRKVVRGAARSVLGTNVGTQIIFTANLRALLHICLMRCVRFAEAEIRQVIGMIARIMAIEAPAYFGHLVEHPSPDGLCDEICGLPVMLPYSR